MISDYAIQKNEEVKKNKERIENVNNRNAPRGQLKEKYKGKTLTATQRNEIVDQVLKDLGYYG